ncbi:MAG: hypothetical protein ABI874_11670 [Chloroflexota bacterium]
MNDHPLPIACNLPAAALAQREQELAATIFRHRLAVRELPDGYEFQFPPDDDWGARLLEFIQFERQCCPFFAFEFAFEPNQGPIWLRMRGGEGVKQLLAADGAVWLAPPDCKP